MSDSLYREYTLRTPNEWKALCEFVRNHAKPANDSGRPLRLIVTDEEADRLDEQIAYFYGVIIKAVVDQAWVTDERGVRRQYSKQVWDEYLSDKFLPCTEIELPTGQKKLVRQSKARGKIGVGAMARFTKEVEAYVTQELGVHLPASDR